MAITASPTSTRRRLARVQHFVFPSRLGFASALAIELLATLLGLPLPAHLVVGLAVHTVLALAFDRDRP